jgi:glycerol-3-phosphate acyltransferase PlsX
VGNALLKFGESMTTAMPIMIRQVMAGLDMGPAQQQAIREVFGGLQKRFNPEEYGGAPLLGLNGVVFIGHGRSSARGLPGPIPCATSTEAIRLAR